MELDVQDVAGLTVKHDSRGQAWFADQLLVSGLAGLEVEPQRLAVTGDGESDPVAPGAPVHTVGGPVRRPDSSAFTNAKYPCRHNNRAYPSAFSDSRTTKVLAAASLATAPSTAAVREAGGHDSSGVERKLR